MEWHFMSCGGHINVHVGLKLTDWGGDYRDNSHCTVWELAYYQLFICSEMAWKAI